MFDVPEFNCTTEVWREQIDGWDIVGHELDAVECQESTQYKGVGLQCLCRAFFSTGAIIGHPHYICQHCDLNDTTDEQLSSSVTTRDAHFKVYMTQKNDLD